MANGNTTSTIDEIGSSSTPLTPNPVNQSKPQSTTPPASDGVVDSQTRRAIFNSTNFSTIAPTPQPVVRQLTNAEIKPGSSEKKIVGPVFDSKVLQKLTPAVLTQTGIDKVATPETLRSIGLSPAKPKPVEPEKVIVNEADKQSKIKIESGVLDKIDERTDFGVPAPRSRVKLEPETEEEVVGQEKLTKSQRAEQQKLNAAVSDEALQAIQASIPGAPKLPLDPTQKQNPIEEKGQVNSKDDEEPKRRRIRIRIGGGTTGTFNPSIPTSTSTSSQPSDTQNQQSRQRTGQIYLPIEGGYDPGEEQSTTSQPEQPQQEASEQREEDKKDDEGNNKNIKDQYEDAKKEYDRLKSEQAKASEPTTQPSNTPVETPGAAAGEGAAGAGEAAAGGAGEAAAGATQAASATTAGTTAATGGATAGAATGLGATLIIAVIVILGVILIAILIYVIASIASTLKTVEDANTQGNSAAFFKAFTPKAGNDIVTSESFLFNITDETAPFTFDSAGNITHVRFSYFYELKPIDDYNKAFLGNNSSSEVIVTDINLQSATSIPSEYKSVSGKVYVLTPYDGYRITQNVPRLQDFPPNFSASNNNDYSWTTYICKASVKAGSSFSGNGRQNACVSSYMERYGMDLEFKESFPAIAIGNRLIINLTGSLSLEYYDKASGAKQGTGIVPINPVTICIDTTNVTVINCTDPNNASQAQQVGNGIVGQPITPGGDVGVVQTGCPVLIGEGERLVCTSGYEPFRVLVLSDGTRVSSPHYANDFVVQKDGKSLTSKQAVSPLNGTVVDVSPTSSYTSLAGKWIKIRDDSNPNVIISLMHLKLSKNYAKDDKVKLGEILGDQFIGLENQYWTAPHFHFETTFAPNKNGSNPEEYLRKGCNQPNYKCN